MFVDHQSRNNVDVLTFVFPTLIDFASFTEMGGVAHTGAAIDQ